MTSRRLLALILGLYLLVTLAYGVINPLFEAPDEHWHFFTAVYIAENQQLPIVEEEYDTWLSQEAAQPPLYYLLSAALIAPINTSTAREEVWLNPFGTQGIGNAAALVNRNQIIHISAEEWPWQGTVLAAHLLRLFSTLLGLGTLLAIYGSARLVWPQNKRLPLLAVALVAFLPQFNFLHGAISNDPLVIFLCSVALWQLIWLWQRPVTPKRLLLLGLTIGLAALTKNAGVLLLLFATGFLAVRALKNGFENWPQKLGRWGWQTTVFLVLPVLLIAGWLWWRNWQLYGDWTATSQFIRLAGGDREFTLVQVLGESGGLWRSLFAVFGWFNLLAPAWVYAVWNALAILGLLGLLKLVISAWQLRVGRLPAKFLFSPQENKDFADYADKKSIQSAKSVDKSRAEQFGRPDKLSNHLLPLLLFGWLLAVYAGLVLFMLRTPAAQGRLLFPAIVPLALGLAAGLNSWRWRWLNWLAPVAALITTGYCLWGVIGPAYAPPPILADLPPDAAPLDLAMGAGLTLRGIKLETETAVPGDTLWFTLYWQAESVPQTPPELVIDVLGRSLTPLGNSHSYHGRGLFPATEWPPGSLIAERMGIRLADNATVPVLARLFVRLVDDASLKGPSVPVGTVAVLPTSWPEPAETVLAEIGNAVQVTAVTVTPMQAKPGETITVDVDWQVIAPPQADWTTLLHLSQPNERPLATGDSPPLAGDYPTRVWAAGQRFSDRYQLTIPADLPDGRYPLWLGMYHSDPTDSDIIERLTLTVSEEPQPNNVLQIGTVEVVAP